MNEVPIRCQEGHIDMVDLQSLAIRSVDKVLSVEGYVCSTCERWEPVFYTTVSLQNKMALLEKTPIGSRFTKRFGKVLRKAENLQVNARKRDGESRNHNMAAPG